MLTDDLFSFATRTKLRFASPKGELTTEQLWDVPLRSRDDFNLNTIAKTANKALKDATEESFVQPVRSALQVSLEVRLEVVKHVIEAKIKEEDTAKKRAENKAERERLLAALAVKQEGELGALTKEEIKKRIESLEV